MKRSLIIFLFAAQVLLMSCTGGSGFGTGVTDTTKKDSSATDTTQSQPNVQ